MDEDEQKCPATNTTPLDTRSFATATACLGSQASSPTDNSSCLPITPPALLISATAISAPRLSWSPNAALDPVIGPAVATLMVSALATPTPSAATATAAATSFSERTMQDTPCFMHLDTGKASLPVFIMPSPLHPSPGTVEPVLYHRV